MKKKADWLKIILIVIGVIILVALAYLIFVPQEDRNIVINEGNCSLGANYSTLENSPISITGNAIFSKLKERLAALKGSSAKTTVSNVQSGECSGGECSEGQASSQTLSNPCLYTGQSGCTPAIGSPINSFDSSWTYQENANLTTALHFLYYKPAGAKNDSQWLVKHGAYAPYLISIPSACWNAFPDKLDFIITSDDCSSISQPACWNGTRYVPVGNLASTIYWYGASTRINNITSISPTWKTDRYEEYKALLTSSMTDGKARSMCNNNQNKRERDKCNAQLDKELTYVAKMTPTSSVINTYYGVGVPFKFYKLGAVDGDWNSGEIESFHCCAHQSTAGAIVYEEAMWWHIDRAATF